MSTTPEPKDPPQLESTTLKKGLLWQQWDRFFSRWKERFFVLTRDYLACFKKGSSLGITEMGTFIYKVSLVDVQGLQWVDKKRDGVIAVKVAPDGQLLLWSAKGLDDWMFALRDAVSRSKGRREALRKSNTLIPQLSDSGLFRSSCFRRQAMTLQHTMSDSHVEKGLILSNRDFQSSLRSSTEHQPTPHMAKRSQRISVLTDIVISGGMEPDVELAFDSELCLKPRNALGPRLAPQCSSGSHTSLVSLGAGARGMIFRPSPRSLQVSPALTQRSLYAQHVLSAPEIAAAPPELRQCRPPASNVVTSEFAFIRPDSPLSRSSHTNTASSTRSECSYQRSQSVPQATNSLPHSATTGVGSNDGAHGPRPSSIYGQPSVLHLTDKPPPPQFYILAQPPDVVPKASDGQHVLVKPVRRQQRRYMHSKSDHSFVNATDKIAHVPSSNGERKGSLAFR